MAKKKRGNLLIYLLLALVAIVVVVAVIQSKKGSVGLEVQTTEVSKETISEKVTASGKIFPVVEVKISSDVSGEIVELLVNEGDSVSKGELLAKIDPDAYISAVERGQASLNNTKAQLAMARSNVESAMAQKENIKAQLDNAQKIHARNVKLLADQVISQAEFDNSSSNMATLEANLRSQDATIRSSQQNVKASEFTVRSTQASLKELRTNLDRTTINAPTSGVVSLMNVEEGERVVGTIQMAGTELMRISNFSSMEVRVEVSENDILRVDLGDEVEIELDAYIERKFSGTVAEIANSAANTAALGNSLSTEQVTNFIVKILVDPESYQDLIEPGEIFPLRPGMSASVEIKTNEVTDALAVPIQAVTTREVEDGKDEDFDEVVFQIIGDTVAQVKIKTGIQDDEFIHVLEGLELGTQIVEGPYNAVSRKLKSGERITIKDKKDKSDDESEESDSN